jgi:cyclic pyranopterin phosphate synthase
MPDLSHFDETGASRMVDTSEKPETLREARAAGCVRMSPATLSLIQDRRMAKGDVLEVARLAAIMGAKRTSDLIPLCHPLPLSHLGVELTVGEGRVEITAWAETTAQTGVEMEALTAVAVAGLAIYDMAKAIDKEMVIGEITLVEKHKDPV